MANYQIVVFWGIGRPNPIFFYYKFILSLEQMQWLVVFLEETSKETCIIIGIYIYVMHIAYRYVLWQLAQRQCAVVH